MLKKRMKNEQSVTKSQWGAAARMLWLSIMVGMLWTSMLCAQESSSHTLTLDEAIHLAIASNRTLKVASLDVDRSKWQIAEFKTNRLPAFSGTVLGSQLLTEPSFTFKEGAFGTFPGIGPVPGKNTEVTSPRRPNAY